MLISKNDEQPQIQPKYPRESTDDDAHSIPPNHGGDSAAGEPTMDLDVVETDDIALNDLMKVRDRGTRDEARVLNGEIMSLIDSLGGNTSKYRRERGKAIRAIVSEMYSPPRVSAVAKLCPSFGILLGFGLDLTTHDTDGKHCDLDDEEMRARAWSKVRNEQPLLLIGTPMCTSFSAWQHINNSKRDPEIVAREYAQGLRHLSFCSELYAYHVGNGR